MKKLILVVTFKIISCIVFMKSMNNVFLSIALVVLLSSCGKEVPDEKKTDPDSGYKSSSKIDTAAFLRENNLTLAPYSDIPPGSSMVVPGTSVYFPVLNMGANSKLLIPDSYEECTILIGKGYFDENTEIIADGEGGIDGHKLPDPWDGGWWQAGQGQRGAKGVNGTNGTSGRNAVQKVKVQIGLMKLITLKVHANGGRGGNGGNGGTGQLGGNKSGPFGSNGVGGDGGDAGSAGNGGNGGRVEVEVWAGTSTIDLPTILQYLSVVGDFGVGGKGGLAGPGNEGGNHSTRGVSGKAGKNGINGVAGSTKISVIPKPPIP